MPIDWSEEPGYTEPAEEEMESWQEPDAPMRLDLLLPAHADTGVATEEGLRAYLWAMEGMVSRHGLPLSILCVRAQETPLLTFLGGEGRQLIARAVARCLRQETRGYDVVGVVDDPVSPAGSAFAIVCPMLNADRAATMAARLCRAMAFHSEEEDRTWLTISIGVAEMGLDLDGPDALIARGMEALHASEENGGGVCRLPKTETD